MPEWAELSLANSTQVAEKSPQQQLYYEKIQGSKTGHKHIEPSWTCITASYFSSTTVQPPADLGSSSNLSTSECLFR